MALVKCKSCGQLISERAQKCPHCGNVNQTLSKNRFNKGLISAIVIVSLLIIAGIIYMLCVGTNNEKSAVASNIATTQQSEPVPTTSTDIENFGLSKGITEVINTGDAINGEVTDYYFSPSGNVVKVSIGAEGEKAIYNFEDGELKSCDLTYQEELGDDELKHERHLYVYEVCDETHTAIFEVINGEKTPYITLTKDDRGRIIHIRYDKFGNEKKVNYNEEGDPINEEGIRIAIPIELVQMFPIKPREYCKSSSNTYVHKEYPDFSFQTK